jgi:CRP/FNR family transcriptional regulator, cyclic AMP receptor protein
VAGPGETLGELSLFEQDGERTADAQALEETECVIIARPALVAFLTGHPDLLLRIISTLSGFIRRKDEALGEASLLDIPARVARKLVELADTRGKATDSGTLIEIALNQRALAGMVGASRENVNRALHRFADLGYIRLTKEGIVVIQRQRLLHRGSGV